MAADSFTIQSVTFDDVDAISKIGHNLFLADRQTQLKALGNVSYTSVEGAKAHSKTSLSNPRSVFVKAISTTGEILGSSGFWFIGFPEGDIPRSDPGEDNSEPTILETQKSELGISKSHEQLRVEEAVAKLEKMEDEDMAHWQNILSPPGSKCIIVVSLSVARRHQGRGIGSALLKWGTDLADKHGVYMWVHSSEMAFRAYLKGGFRVVGTLNVDLDAWAPEPPKNEGEKSIWGHYLIRYMKRLPQED